MEQNEVTAHWARNSYFLVVASLLLVALSQFKVQVIQVLIGASGLTLSLVWVVIQDSSSRYLKHWNGVIYDLGKSAGLPPFYDSKGRKIPIREVAYVLPLPFVALWSAVIILAAFGMITSGSTLP
jgi:hypothetical protein